MKATSATLPKSKSETPVSKKSCEQATPGDNQITDTWKVFRTGQPQSNFSTNVIIIVIINVSQFGLYNEELRHLLLKSLPLCLSILLF